MRAGMTQITRRRFFAQRDGARVLCRLEPTSEIPEISRSGNRLKFQAFTLSAVVVRSGVRGAMCGGKS
jgi:hypothetical protein